MAVGLGHSLPPQVGAARCRAPDAAKIDPLERSSTLSPQHRTVSPGGMRQEVAATEPNQAKFLALITQGYHAWHLNLLD
jgi:hypothetical protein